MSTFGKLLRKQIKAILLEEENLIQDQLSAIEESIIKWQNIVFHHHYDNGGEDCACCIKFRLSTDKVFCYNCPIAITVNDIFCHSTPYDNWARYQNYFDKIVFDKTSQDLANHELSFLYNIRRIWIEKLMKVQIGKYYKGAI